MNHIVRVLPATDQMLPCFAEVMVEAFGTERINAYVFDFSRRATWAARYRAALVETRLYIQSKSHVLVAVRGDEVLGGAILSVNRRWSLLWRIGAWLRWAAAALPMTLAIRWRKAFQVMSAVRLSRRIEGPYHTLAALAVHPGHQGKGIGRLLLEEVHRISDQSPGSRGVYLYTADTRNKAIYEQAGYRTVEERRAGAIAVYHMFRPAQDGANH